MLQEKSFDTGIGELLIYSAQKRFVAKMTVNSKTKNNEEGKRKRNVTLEKTMKTKKDVGGQINEC